MGNYGRTLFIGLLTAALVACISPLKTIAASSTNHFIDLDGDGFNDNLVDSDNNSIPDIFESREAGVATSIFSSVTKVSPNLFSNKSSGVSLSVSYESRADHFNGRLSGCLGLDKCRNDFESDFGASIGFSLGSGGGCVGGVCF